MRTNNPPRATDGPTRLPRRPIVLNSQQYHAVMAALADYDRITKGTLLSQVALEIAAKLNPEEAT